MNKNLDELLDVLADEIVTRVHMRLAAKDVENASAPPLEETLSHMLENAAWFKHLLGELVDNTDFRHYVEQVVAKLNFAADIEEALETFDFGDAIKEYLQNNVNITFTAR